MNAEDLVLNFKKDISSLSRTERRRAIESVRDVIRAAAFDDAAGSTKHLGVYLAWFRWCRTFMATDPGTAERTVARQLANGTCGSRIRDMFNVRPPYMDYWDAPAAQGR